MGGKGWDGGGGSQGQVGTDTLPFLDRTGLEGPTDHELTGLSKADDLIFLRPVSFQKCPLGGPVKALQGIPQNSSGHWPAQCWALAEMQLVQDASLGQIKKQLPLALQVQGRAPTCQTLTVSSGNGHCGWEQE